MHVRKMCVSFGLSSDIYVCVCGICVELDDLCVSTCMLTTADTMAYTLVHTRVFVFDINVMDKNRK